LRAIRDVIIARKRAPANRVNLISKATWNEPHGVFAVRGQDEGADGFRGGGEREGGEAALGRARLRHDRISGQEPSDTGVGARGGFAAARGIGPAGGRLRFDRNRGYDHTGDVDVVHEHAACGIERRRVGGRDAVCAAAARAAPASPSVPGVAGYLGERRAGRRPPTRPGRRRRARGPGQYSGGSSGAAAAGGAPVAKSRSSPS